MQRSFWWWQPHSDRYIISLFPHLHTSSPSLTSLVVSVDVKHHIYLLTCPFRSAVANSGSDPNWSTEQATKALPPQKKEQINKQTTNVFLSRVLSFLAEKGDELVKPVLNCSYDSFLNWTFSSPNMVWKVQTLLHSQMACNEMQASARTYGRRAADSMIENVG